MDASIYLEFEQVSAELVELCRLSLDTEDKVTKILQLLSIVKRMSAREKQELFVPLDTLKALRLLLCDIDKKLRVQSCRAIRYITCNNLVLDTMVSINIPIFLMICLEREDTKYYWERLGALKWIRHLIDNYPLSIPRCCILSLIGIASNGKHEYQRICVDSLRELCIINPAIINSCNGFKVLIDLVLNPQLSSISHSLVLTMLYILDHPNTRKYLRRSLDIQRLLSPFVSVNACQSSSKKKQPQNKVQLEQREARRSIARRTLMTMLKSMTGIFYLGANSSSSHSMLGVLVSLMKLPNAMSGISWARRTMFSVLDRALLPLDRSRKYRGANLIVNYVCLLLMAFIRNGLIECLVSVGMRSDLDLAPRARVLLQRIQFLSAKYLPPTLCSQITSISRVIADAATYSAGLDVTVQRNFANMMISELTEDASLEMNQNKDQDDDGDDDDDENEFKFLLSFTICHRLGVEFDINSTFIRYRYMFTNRDIPSSLMVGDRMPYHQHRAQSDLNANHFNQFSFKSQKSIILNSLKFDQNASYSENFIIASLRETGVIQTKDYQLWNMDLVWKILNGPLWNIANLNVALNKTRFMKRLLQYLKPSKLLFTSLRYRMSTMRHSQCAAQLFRVLTSCDEGAKYPYFCELIGEMFQALKDQISLNLGNNNNKQQQSSYNPFTRSSMSRTLAPTYIVLIGILSETQRGLQFFTKHNMITYLITDHSIKNSNIVGPNDYLLRLIATNLDYTVDNTFPLLFNKWIAKGSYCLRKVLITHLSLLYRAQMPKFDEWSIDVLAILLKTKEQRLALTALKVLEKINLSQNSHKSQQYLIDLIHTQPTDGVIGDYGQFLFIKMLSTREGLQFLRSNDWLNKKRRAWSSENGMHTTYTLMLETALCLAIGESADDIIDNIEIPHHLLFEDRSDEEELYAEYLTQFSWSISVTIDDNMYITDSFFDDNFYYYCDCANKPIGLGEGIHAICINAQSGCDEAIPLINKETSIRISINIGDECLNELYSSKSLTKVLSMRDLKTYRQCSLIIEDQLYLFFDENGRTGLCRIFWSLSVPDRKERITTALVRPLPHFYGELAKTNEGCTYILSNDEFNMDLQQFIFTVHSAFLEMMNHRDDRDINYTIDSKGTLVDNNSNLQLRSCLWALGMIGSSKTGLNLLNSLCNNSNGINIIDDICILTLESPTLSIRGTCLYVLGLLSRTSIGMQQLSKYGFGFPADNLELDLAVAIPEDIDDFFKVQKTQHCIESPHMLNAEISCYSPPHLCRPNNMKPLDPNELLGKQGHTEETILAHISSLCNNVTQKSSASALHGLRMRKPSVFTNPLLFREVLKLLNTYQFKLAAKRFILFNLFDNVILDQDTLEELFNERNILNEAILPHKQIRQWRYQYKKQLIEKKKKIQQRNRNKYQSQQYHHQQQQQQQQQQMHAQQQQHRHQGYFNQPQIAQAPPKKQLQQAKAQIAPPKPPPPQPPQAPQQQPQLADDNNTSSYAHKLSMKLALQQQQQKKKKQQQQQQQDQVFEVRGRQRSDAQNKGRIQNVHNNPYSISNQFNQNSNKNNNSNNMRRNINQINQINQNNQNNQNNMNPNWNVRLQTVGNGIQRRISELQGAKPNKGQEYAESPKQQMAGPNPLQSDQSINYD